MTITILSGQKPICLSSFMNRLCSFFQSYNFFSKKAFFFSILTFSSFRVPTS